MSSHEISSQRFGSAVVWIAISALVAQILVLLRTLVMAHLFGASPRMDAFFVARTLPQFVIEHLPGVILAASLPGLAPLLTRDPPAGWRVLRRVRGGLLFLCAALWGGLVIFRDPLLAVLGPGLSPDASSDAALWLTILAGGLLLLPWLSTSTVALRARDHVLVPSLARPLDSVGILLGMAFGAATLGVGSIALGWLAGEAARTLLLGTHASRLRPLTQPSDAAVLPSLAALALPLGLVAMVHQIPVVVVRSLATLETIGVVSALVYASRLLQVPVALFAGSVGEAAFGAFARAAGEDSSRLADLSARMAARALLLCLPAAVASAVLAEPLTDLLLRRGAFDQRSAELTSTILIIFSIGLPGIALESTLARASLAQGNARIPLTAAMISVVVHVGAAYLLQPSMGYRGLALATSLGALANGFGLLILLSIRWGAGVCRTLTLLMRGPLIALIPFSAAAIGAHLTADQLLSDSRWAQTGFLAACVGLATALYLVVAHRCGNEDAGLLLAKIVSSHRSSHRA